MARTPYIFPFQGIRDGNIIHFEGQVLHVSKSGNIIDPKDSIWKNLKRTIQIYTPTKIKKIQRVLEFQLNGSKYHTSLDKYGYFYLNIDVGSSSFEEIKDVKFFLGGKQILIHDELGLSSLLLKNNYFDTGVISDIDDTILVSHSTNKIKKSLLVGIKNAHTRKIVKETKEIYDILESKGCQFFYVSNSETNLYLLIKWVLKINNLPNGPVFLNRLRSYRSIFKIKSSKNIEKKYSHKISRIVDILELFPDKKFILIGDSSQGDPEVYTSITTNYPNRIKAILIRDITNNSRRNILTKYKKDLDGINVPFIFYNTKKPIDNLLKEIDF